MALLSVESEECRGTSDAGILVSRESVNAYCTSEIFDTDNPILMKSVVDGREEERCVLCIDFWARLWIAWTSAVPQNLAQKPTAIRNETTFIFMPLHL